MCSVRAVKLALQPVPLSTIPGHVLVFTHPSTYAGEGWVEYEEDDAGRELAEIFSVSGVAPAPAPYGARFGSGTPIGGPMRGPVGAPRGAYGGGGMPLPYGMGFAPPPAGSAVGGTPKSPISSPGASPQTVISSATYDRARVHHMDAFEAHRCVGTQAATASYSTSATVPGVQSTSTLTNYANVAAFNATERLRVSVQISIVYSSQGVDVT